MFILRYYSLIMAQHIKAEIDPAKAPETSNNIREYVRRYGTAGLTTSFSNLNSEAEKKARRQEAISHVPKGQNTVIDEEPPAVFRKPGDPFITRETSRKESKRTYGVHI